MEDNPLEVIPDLSLWSENYAYMITDSSQGFACFLLMGRWIPDPTVWREFLMVQMPDGRMLHHKSWGRATSRNVVSAALARIELDGDAGCRIFFDGPIAETSREVLLKQGTRNQSLGRLTLDLSISSEVPVWNMSGHASSAEEIAGKMHIEQVGVASGTVTFGDETVQVNNAFMQRDHSRGVRDVTKFYRHCWAQGSFPERDLTFNLYSMLVFGRENEPMMNASVTQAGKRYPATIIEIAYMDSRADAMKPYSITLACELGNMTFRIVDFVASFPTAFVSPWDIVAGVFPEEHSVTGVEEAVVWEWEGLRGEGWSERSFTDQAFDKQGAAA
ncbi:hypothetical protein [Novosphingobium aquimarinum]|uniref:hypothetical protein n=1 Tax=Novosphingobium aquimarinum TaxID=2682494 RepID=UPI0012EBC254|nr:hypothetical protein [Novosphingobium aquimarinum]